MRRRRLRLRRAGPLTLALFLGLAACGDDGGTSSDAPPTTTSTPPTDAPAPEPLRILLTNDDGFDSAGLDTVARALLALPDVELTVVAPAEDQSGASDRTTAGPVADLVAAEVETAGGHAATSVAGYPADSIRYALEVTMADALPHVVVSGSNEGQNIGPLARISGTVGAAREAARAGIPAIALSQGLLADAELDHSYGADEVAAWIEAHRAELLDGPPAAEPTTVVSVNVPTCAEGERRGIVDVPLDLEAALEAAFDVDCTSTLADPASDVEGFANGFAVRSDVPVELEPAG